MEASTSTRRSSPTSSPPAKDGHHPAWESPANAARAWSSGAGRSALRVREKIFDAVIDKVEVKPLARCRRARSSTTTPRSATSTSSSTSWASSTTARYEDDTVTVIHFSEIRQSGAGLPVAVPRAATKRPAKLVAATTGNRRPVGEQQRVGARLGQRLQCRQVAIAVPALARPAPHPHPHLCPDGRRRRPPSHQSREPAATPPAAASPAATGCRSQTRARRRARAAATARAGGCGRAGCGRPGAPRRGRGSGRRRRPPSARGRGS